MSRKLNKIKPTSNKERGYGVVVATGRDNLHATIEIRSRLTETDELLYKINQSVNTNYEKEKELYKEEKKKLVTV